MATILMVPGLFGNKDVWGKIQNFFEESKFNCCPFTLPYRKKLTEIPSLELGRISTAEDINFLRIKIAKIKENLKPNECFIGMGHSRGALLILKLQEIVTQQGEKLFDKIILITPAPPKGISALSWPAIKSYLSVTPKWRFWKKPVKRSFAGMASAVMDETMAAQDKMKLYNGLSWESGLVVAQTIFSPPKINPDKINCPVLVIGASQDRLVPPPIAKKIAAMLGLGVTYQEVNGPHLVLKGEARKDLCEKILDWLWNI